MINMRDGEEIIEKNTPTVKKNLFLKQINGLVKVRKTRRDITKCDQCMDF